MANENTNYNTADNGFVNMIIAVVVALIVTATVLIPAIGMVGNDDSGGGSDGEFEGVVLNDLQTMYAEMGLTVPFKTFQSYYASPYGLDYYALPISKDISNLELTLDMDYIEQISAVENTEGYSTDQNITLFMLNVYSESGDEFDFSIYLTHGADTNPNTLMFNIGEYIGDNSNNQYGFVSDISAFNLTVHGGVMSLSVDAVADGSAVQIRESADVREKSINLIYISDDEIGWVGGWMYAYDGEYIVPFPDLMEGCVFQTSDIEVEYEKGGESGFASVIPLIEVKNIQNDTLTGTVKVYAEVYDENDILGYDYNQYFIVQYEIPLTEVSEGVYRFVDEGESATWAIVGNVGMDDAESISLGTNASIWGNFENYASSVNANPVTIDEGGGSSGGSSNNGVISTLMSVIPIMVILAILMYAVSYLRASKTY